MAARSAGKIVEFGPTGRNPPGLGLVCTGVSPLTAEQLGPVRPWFEEPDFERKLAAKKLDPKTERLVRDYRADGYVVIDPILDPNDLEALPGEIAPRFAYDTGPYFSDETRIQDGWTVNERIRRIAASKPVLEILETFYERRPIPFQTLNFCKGSEQATHSDTIHFHSFPPGFMCGVWVALEDIDGGNGPLHYYPRSQELPFYTLEDLGLRASTQQQQYEHYPLYEQFVAELMLSSGLERKTLDVKRGQALIWSANLFHGGERILERGRSRWSQVTHYYFEGCFYYTPLLSDVSLGKITSRNIVDVRNGQPVASVSQYDSPVLALDFPAPPQGGVAGLRRQVRGLKSKWDRLIDSALRSR